MEYFNNQPETAEQWTRAVECFSKGDISGALFLYKRLADEGESLAFVEIGNIYELGGKGVRRDPDSAASWYRKAIFYSDDPNAHLGLARLYFNDDVPCEGGETFLRHCRKAVAADLPVAHLLLGSAFHVGRHVEKDLVRAAEHYAKAAEAGLVLAYRHLGQLEIERGRIVRGVRLCIWAAISATIIAIKNRSDSRLAGVE